MFVALSLYIPFSLSAWTRPYYSQGHILRAGLRVIQQCHAP